MFFMRSKGKHIKWKNVRIFSGEMEIIEFEKEREKRYMKKNQSFSGCGTKCSTICLIRVPEGKEKDWSRQKMNNKFRKLLKFPNLQK